MGDGLNKWHICNYYREFRELGVPGSETLQAQKNRFETFLNSIENMERKNNTIILGDFNIDLTDENNTFIQLQQDFKDSLLNCLPLAGFTQIVKNPTRHCSGRKSSLIDHVWLNNLSKMEQVRNVSTESDHDLIITKVLIKGKVKTNKMGYQEIFQNLIKTN